MLLREKDGYSLPTVLVVVFLITTLLFGVINWLFFTNLITLKALSGVKLKAAAIKDVNEYLSDTNNTAGNIKVNSNTFYLDLTATETNERDTLKGNFVYGILPTDYFNNALTITRPNLRAAVTGNTEINGNILVTRKRIVKGNIYGIGSTSGDYLNGEIKVKKTISAKLFGDSLLKNIFNNRDEGIVEKNIFEKPVFTKKEADSLKGSTIYVNSEMRFQGNFLKSKTDEEIKIYSRDNVNISAGIQSNMFFYIMTDSSITIEEGCDISNAVFIAKKGIKIEKGCVFKNESFISNKEIIVQESQFNYPTVLAVYTEAEDTAQLKNKIEIKSSAVNGTLMLVTTITGLPKNKSKIFIDEKSKIHGLIYSENNAEIRGEVYGSVFTFNLLYTTEDKEYI
ncbi:MAG: hypothetical protein D6707_11215, partial [Bacteroidetes bacterium]